MPLSWENGLDARPIAIRSSVSPRWAVTYVVVVAVVVAVDVLGAPTRLSPFSFSRLRGARWITRADYPRTKPRLLLLLLPVPARELASSLRSPTTVRQRQTRQGQQPEPQDAGCETPSEMSSRRHGADVQRVPSIIPEDDAHSGTWRPLVWPFSDSATHIPRPVCPDASLPPGQLLYLPKRQTRYLDQSSGSSKACRARRQLFALDQPLGAECTGM
ncbi:hypothetical protein LZ30DRAFT_52155 [Colletotrichum cereale]|nr:hypothetical protein LZ30DRAFT_52155 [Colletotrichum cereale]